MLEFQYVAGSLGSSSSTKRCGAEQAGSLVRLDISFNAIADVAGLEKLTRLQDLSLFANRVAAVDGLTALSQLELLSLGILPSGSSLRPAYFSHSPAMPSPPTLIPCMQPAAQQAHSAVASPRSPDCHPRCCTVPMDSTVIYYFAVERSAHSLQLFSNIAVIGWTASATARRICLGSPAAVAAQKLRDGHSTPHERKGKK